MVVGAALCVGVTLAGGLAPGPATALLLAVAAAAGTALVVVGVGCVEEIAGATDLVAGIGWPVNNPAILVADSEMCFTASTVATTV